MDDSQKTRRLFFWTLFVLFWLVSATIIGYAFGYRFSFQKGIFIYGGSITLKTTPQKVDVYLDGTLMPSGTLNVINRAYHINGIRPGEHLLEVKSQNYQTWSKKISVHSGLSTEFWNIVLAQDSYTYEDYESPGIERFFISPHKNLIAFSQQIENNFFIKILDPETSKIVQVFSLTDYVFTKDDTENIEWSPQAHRLIVPASTRGDISLSTQGGPILKSGEKNYLITTIDTGEALDLANISGMNNLSDTRWDPKNKDVLFFVSDDNLYRMDLNDIQNKKLIAEHIASYDLSQKYLFYFQLPEGIVYKINLNDATQAQQVTTSAPENMSDNSYKIIVYEEDRIIFLNKSHNLYIYNKGKENTYFNKLSNDAQGAQFSNDGKKLLFWTDKEIFVYFVREWEVQPVRAENELLSITRLTDPAKNVQWTSDYEHVLFTNNNKIKIIEIDNRDNRNMMDILSLNGNDSIVINNFTDGKLYYTEKNADDQKTLHSFYFPEYTTLLQGLLPGSTPANATN